MARYGQAFKNKVLAKLLPPSTASLEEVSQEVGVSVDTLERWRAESLSTPARERAWTATARLNAVITTTAMDEFTRNAWCRENGVYPQELDAWRTRAPPRPWLSPLRQAGYDAPFLSVEQGVQRYMAWLDRNSK